MTTNGGDSSAASRNITQRIADLGDWRGATLARVRTLLHDAVPGVEEEWKWRGVPVWSYEGIICTGESYKEVVKLTFFRGAALPDPRKLFNSSLDGNARRAIDIREGEKLDESALKALFVAAADANVAARTKKPGGKPAGKPAGKPTGMTVASPAPAAKKPVAKRSAGKKPAATKQPAKKAAAKK